MYDIFENLIKEQRGTVISKVLSDTDKFMLRKSRLQKGTEAYIAESKRLLRLKEILDDEFQIFCKKI